MKEIIKFVNSTDNVECNIFSISHSLVTLLFSNSLPNKNAMKEGFYLLNEYNFSIQGDYSAYKYIYKIDAEAKTVTFTNDPNNKYIEPTATTEPELTDSEKEELEMNEFNSIKTSKVAEMSGACESAIENGVYIDGKHYSYTIQDQSNLVNAMNLAKITGLDVPYHADGESCSLYSYAQIATVYMNEQMNLTMQQTYFNQLKLYIESITDVSMKDEVSAITYGDELSGKYLEDYNNIIDQSNKIMVALTSIEG